MNSTPASVLIIESHPMMRSALCSAIEAEPDLKVIEPDALAGGTITISILDDLLFLPGKPDIILLALKNPEEGGLGTLKTLQSFLPATPILVLTTNEMAGQEQAALAAGAHAVLTKAASRTEIINALRQLRNKALMNHSEKNVGKGGME